MQYDLILRNGRLIDPGRKHDQVGDIAFADGKVAAFGRVDGSAARDRDVTGCIVMPGMIDLHTHVYWGGTSISIDADALARRCGTTTWVDVGSAGPGNFPGFRKHVIEHSQTRILAYLHVSHAGIFGFSPKVMVGESQDMRLMDVETCAQIALDNPDLIRGIKVRIGAHTSGVNGITPLHYAIEAAERAGLPVMCHIDNPPPRYSDVLAVLRPGDVLTHCFRPFPNAPIHADGRVREACWQARERGVLFDIGHGKGSFAWPVAEAMLAAGFAPDVISSDVHVLCIDGPAYDNLVTMSKFLCLGMDLTAIIRAVTLAPAQLLKRPDLADLSPGSTGDATAYSAARRSGSALPRWYPRSTAASRLSANSLGSSQTRRPGRLRSIGCTAYRRCASTAPRYADRCGGRERATHGDHGPSAADHVGGPFRGSHTD